MPPLSTRSNLHPLPQVLLAAVCTQFIRVYDLSTDAAAPVHTFYLPATAEDASGDGAGSCIRDVELVPPGPAVTTATPAPDLSGEAAAEGWGAGTGAPPLLATAVVLTGAGRLYGKGISSPRRSSEAAGGEAGGAGYVHDGEIRHRLIIPSALEEETGGGGGSGGGSGPGAGGSGGGGGVGGTVTARAGGGDGNNSSESGRSRGRSESVGGASAYGGGSGREDEEVESPVSAAESPSYLYLNAFAGCEFDDAVNDSPDESLIFAEPGLRRRGWAAATASASASSSAAAGAAAADTVLAMSPARLARAPEAAETAAASFGALHFSGQMGLLVVARGGKSTLALRLRGAGATTAVAGGFVLLPRPVGGASGDSCALGSGDVGATPTAQGATTSSDRSDGAASSSAAMSAAVAAATATETATATLQANSCLPPYTRFLDYWDGACDLAGEDSGGGAATAAASLVCVASGGDRVNADRVLAMNVGGGSGEVRAHN